MIGKKRRIVLKQDPKLSDDEYRVIELRNALFADIGDRMNRRQVELLVGDKTLEVIIK